PDEAREVTRVYQQFESADERIDRRAPDAAERRAQAAEAKKQRDEVLKQSLGAERFAELKQGIEGYFASIYRITERYELPREVAVRAAAFLKDRNESLKALRS